MSVYVWKDMEVQVQTIDAQHIRSVQHIYSVQYTTLPQIVNNRLYILRQSLNFRCMFPEYFLY